MAKYSDIKGFTVQTLSTDTSLNKMDGGTWGSGGDLNTARHQGARSGGGTQTAGILACGGTPASPYNSDAVERYNGSSWSETTEVNTGRRSVSTGGGYDSYLVVAGYVTENSNAVESRNGSAWTEIAEVNTARRQLAMSTAGSNTAAIAFAGYSTAYVGIAESWNGSAWTEVGDLNTPRSSLTSTDQSATAALGIGGYRGPPTADRTKFVEQWDGSSWTEIADINQERMDTAAGGGYKDCIIFGGIDGPTVAAPAATEHWDGSTWTEIADLSTGRYELAGTGNSGAALAIAGKSSPGAQIATTEEFTTPVAFNQITLGQLYFNSTTNAFKETINDVPNGVWSSGGNVNEARELLAGWGTNNNLAGVAGGNNTSDVAQSDTELYNGTSWTEVNEINSARGGVAGCGLYAAGIIAGAAPPTHGDKVEEWDGSSWSEVAEMNTNRGFASMSGTQDANLIIGGYYNPPTQRYANVEEWNGSSWTEIADLNTGRPGTGAAAGAPVTDTVAFGGYAGPPFTPQVITEKWDGSSWTEVGDMNNAKNVVAGHGDSGSNAGAFGGSQPSTGAHNEIWNGTSWTEVANTANAGWRQQGGTPDMSSGICSAGGPPAFSFVEEWNAPLVNKTVTAS